MSKKYFGGRVFIGNGEPTIEEGIVVIEHNKIIWVGNKNDVPQDLKDTSTEIIGGDGFTIMSGLIDGHTHISFGEARSEEENALYTPVEFRTLRAAWNAKKVLQAGVTSAFDAATTYKVALAVKDAIDSGMFEGPRFSVSGKHLTSHQGLEDSFPSEMPFPVGQSAILTKTKEELVEGIRLQIKDGFDNIKVSGSNDSLITPDALGSSAYTYEELKIIADETRRLGATSVVHARSRESIRDAARAGFDIIFHASYIDDEGIELCLKNGCIITPTMRLLVNLVEAKNVLRKEENVTRELGASGKSAFEKELDAAYENLRKAYEAGVPLVGGSESGWSPVPYGYWHAHEMETFVQKLGMSHFDALCSMTGVAARTIKRFGHQVGVLEVGRLADLLVVEGNPDEDVTLLQDKKNIKRIYKNGDLIDRTPVADRKRMWYEKTKIFLNGVYYYDSEKKEGYVAKEW